MKPKVENSDDDRDYRTFYDATYLRAWDLPSGRDATLTIHHTEKHVIKGAEGEEDKRPVIFFSGRDGKALPKGLVCNRGMGKTVAKLYGPRMRDWRGKPISVYATTCDAFGATHDVIRIRPTVKKTSPRGTGAAAAPTLPAAPVADAEFEETPLPETVGAAE